MWHGDSYAVIENDAIMETKIILPRKLDVGEELVQRKGRKGEN